MGRDRVELSTSFLSGKRSTAEPPAPVFNFRDASFTCHQASIDNLPQIPPLTPVRIQFIMHLPLRLIDEKQERISQSSARSVA